MGLGNISTNVDTKRLRRCPRRVAKLFRNGASQAVRLPAEFRFDGDEVFIRREPATGDVVLSRMPRIDTWDELFDFLDEVQTSDDFMSDRPMNQLPVERDLFQEES